jgi:hypothetical protein
MMVEIISTQVVTPAGGTLLRCKHMSASTQTHMIFALFLPATYQTHRKTSPFPTLYWLSGLTCTDENFCQKAGPAAFPMAEKEGTIRFAFSASLMRVLVFMINHLSHALVNFLLEFDTIDRHRASHA